MDSLIFFFSNFLRIIFSASRDFSIGFQFMFLKELNFIMTLCIHQHIGCVKAYIFVFRSNIQLPVYKIQT